MTQKDKPVRTRRLWRWLLGISLALNLLVIGVLGGSALRHVGADNPRWGHDLRAGFSNPYMRALPETTRQKMRSILADSTPDREEMRAARRAHFAQAAAALAADPFDMDAFRALVETQQSVAFERQELVQDVWLSVVDGMDAPTRKAYAAQLLEKRDRRQGRRRSAKE